MKTIAFAGLCLALSAGAGSATVVVTDTEGRPLPTAMVREVAAQPQPLDTRDGGYPLPRVARRVDIDITRFTDAAGQAQWPERGVAVRYLVRKPGYREARVDAPPAADTPRPPLRVVLERETDPRRLAEAKPANVWLGALDLGDAERKRHFMLQCGFCHQQGNAALRRERPAAEWDSAIRRMVRYGSRLASEDQKVLPALLESGWRRLREHPELLADPLPWDPALASATVTEWPVGDAMSQAHDQLLARDGRVYVADNIQDRIYAVDPRSHEVTVHKIPHREGEPNGGLLAARLKEFPRHDSTSNAHSLAQSARDGHIFITPSAQRRLVEFDPKTGAFTLHEMPGGFYPHTIRIDAQDRVWFTMALSNQIAQFDRRTGRFTLHDLPTRSKREAATVSMIGGLFKLMSWGVPLSNWLAVDRQATGTPLPYGIDLTPDGTVWATRLHSNELVRLDPRTGQVTLIPTPFAGPRRLRSDAAGNLWVTAFPESAIARYEPSTGRFTRFDLPVRPKGSDTPYALNVDKARGRVWVTGNQSDMLHMLDIATERWRSVPLPRRVAFTRDIEIAADGSVFTSTSSFPSWHVEDGQPTVIHVRLD